MTAATKERRGRAIKRPPSRLGRLLIALRESVGHRALNPGAHPKFLENVKKYRPQGLSRREAFGWIQDLGESVSEEEIRRLETGRRTSPSPEVLRVLLTVYGLSEPEIDSVINDPNLNNLGGTNPHLLTAWRMRDIAVGEFGPLIRNALRVGEHVSTWIEVEKAGIQGFVGDEITIKVSQNEVVPPPNFVKLANDAKDQNAGRMAKGIRGWTDNATLCLSAVTSELGSDIDERNKITLHMDRSWYRYNVAAKQEIGAEYRWRALQGASVPLKPVAFLASGVGVCINIICDNGQSIVIGHRSNDETFRKGEFDIAVVEGIRPSSDVIDGKIDINTVIHRGLAEELGLDRAVRGRKVPDLIKRLVVFEFGCDLEFYQWNFLAFAEVSLDFDTLFAGWQKAKDRKENQTLRTIPCDEQSVTKFLSEHPIWSSGMACALRSFDYL
ncbi:helix-turn-helix transcriptional regulator [Bradyrhizobium sp. SZCCHNR1015]|uniref:helix-turn-helix domain-containing protein n=1 Tax=Bradyrhizobium sp. SZCCHNR1015 TaxID=3057338 RepID=UPI002916434E|nr:helix-turn-helix transcriptional regulator [Bradyrhizobium sp. SZCCHNR1015]